MRRNVLLAGFLMIAAASVYAGVGTQFPRHLATLHYENSSGERGISFFETNEDGLPTRGIWMLEDGSRSSINRYSTKGDHVVLATRLFSDGRTSTETVEVEDGRLAIERFERSDGISGFARYEYDAQGRLTRIVCDRAKGWFTGEIVPLPDDAGRLASANILKDGERIGSIAYGYDSDGNLAREHWTVGDWTQTFGFEYQRCDDAERRAISLNAFAKPSPHRVISKETYDFSGEGGGPSTFAYDDAGRLVAKTFVRSDGLSTQTDYLYECSGVVSHAYRRYSTGKAAVFTYAFDGNGMIVRRTWVASDGARGSETYERNEVGNPVRARFESMDGWLTGDLEFVSSEDGKLVSGTYRGDDGVTAELGFDYDDVADLRVIRWKFPSGKSQTYTFEYETVP